MLYHVPWNPLGGARERDSRKSINLIDLDNFDVRLRRIGIARHPKESHRRKLGRGLREVYWPTDPTGVGMSPIDFGELAADSGPFSWRLVSRLSTADLSER